MLRSLSKYKGFPRYRSFFLLLPLAVLFLPAASSAGQISSVICTLALSLTGLTGKAFATVALIALGAGALVNRVSWATALSICFGIGIIFGSGSIMSALGMGNGGCTTAASFTFSCNGPLANGNIMDADSLAGSQGANQTGGIFARTIFIFKDTIGNAMSAMYCSVADSLKGAMGALLIVFVITFGVGIIGGIINFNLKESAVYLAKIALVWAFAMDPAWGIGIGYNFFVSFAEEGANIAMSGIQAASGQDLYTISKPDALLGDLFTATTSGTSPLTSILNVPPTCFTLLLPLAALLILFMPFVIIFIVLVIVQYIGLFAKCLLGYLSALVLISFLFILAPLFLGFALFKTTSKLFEGWISLLTSFALQMVVMFGFLALLSMIPVAKFFISMLMLLKEYDKTFEVFLATFTMHFCGICDYLIAGPLITCKIHGNVGINPTQAILEPFSKQAAAAGYMLSVPDKFGNLYWVISLLNLLHRSDFAQFVIGQVMALFLIGRVLEDFIKKAPEFAKALAGSGMAAALGGKGSEGKGAAVNYLGMGAMEAGFNGLKNGLYSGGSAINPFKKEGGGFTINPLVVGRNATRNAIGSWGHRLSSAVVGEKEEIFDADGNVVGYHKRQGGLIGGILYGAYDESTLQGQTAKRNAQIQRANIAKQQLEYNQANAKVTDTTNAMANAEQELEKITESTGDSPASQVAKEVVSLKTEIKALDRQLREKNAEIANVQQEIVALESSGSPDSAKLAALLSQLDGLQKEVSNLEAQKESQVDTLQNANSALDKLLAEQDEIVEKAQELARVEREIEIKNTKIDEIQAQIAGLQESGITDVAMLASLSAQLATLKGELAELGSQHSAVKKTLRESQKVAHDEAIGLAEQEKAVEKKLAKAKNNHELALEEAEKEEKKLRKAQKKLELTHSGAIRSVGNSGLLETRSEVDNELLNRSDLERKERDETSAEFDRLETNRREMKKYGKLVTATETDNYFMLQIPQSAGDAVNYETLEKTRAQADYNLRNLSSQINGLPADISPGDRKALMQRIASVENMVESGQTEIMLNNAMSEITSIGNDIARLSKTPAGKK